VAKASPTLYLRAFSKRNMVSALDCSHIISSCVHHAYICNSIATEKIIDTIDDSSVFDILSGTKSTFVTNRHLAFAFSEKPCIGNMGID